MAKARTTDVLSPDGPIADRPSLTAHADAPQAQPPVDSQPGESCAVRIEIPLTGHPPATEFVFHVDCKLTPQQSTVARRIAQQLDFQNARLNNGQRIVNVHGALKWVLEQIANQIE
mgnify:CR=1 FL=1